LPPPLGEVPQCAHWGGEGKRRTPLSQKSKIFASSPKGRAKATFGGRLPAKLKFETLSAKGPVLSPGSFVVLADLEQFFSFLLYKSS